MFIFKNKSTFILFLIINVLIFVSTKTNKYLEIMFTTSNLRSVMQLAWQFVKRNGLTMSEALKTAWRNVKLQMEMKKGIVKFYFQKVDGSIREAYGTLNENLLPEAKGSEKKQNDTIQTYFDTEVQEFRCFKKANLAA